MGKEETIRAAGCERVQALRPANMNQTVKNVTSVGRYVKRFRRPGNYEACRFSIFALQPSVAGRWRVGVVVCLDEEKQSDSLGLLQVRQGDGVVAACAVYFRVVQMLGNERGDVFQNKAGAYSINGVNRIRRVLLGEFAKINCLGTMWAF